MRVTQDRPASFSSFWPPWFDADSPPWRGEVGSIAQLLTLPFVRAFWAAPGFYQFSVAHRDQEPALLMAEFEGGACAYVVARLSGPDTRKKLRPLPDWKPKEDRPEQESFKPVVTDPLGPPLDE